MGNSNRHRVAEQAAMYLEKRQIIDLVRKRFTRFGDDVLAIVLGYALQPKRMHLLLNRFRIKPRGDGLEAQLEAIWTFLADSSPREFIKRLKKKKRKQIEAANVDELDGDEELAEMAEAEVRDLIEDPDDEATNDTVRRPDGAEDAQWVDTPQYRGSERRSGIERRSRRDRRADVLAINSNRRYGGDRRKRPKGRRRNDT